MYYIVYGLLYLVSLLPFFILYAISDLAFVILYYIIGYRRKIVMTNLTIAFPEKTLNEREVIMRRFYRNLCDTFIETIKLISISQKELTKRAFVSNRVFHELEEKGLTMQVYSGHQMNWEYANLALPKGLSIPWITIYMHINNATTNRLFKKIRSRFNVVLISAGDFSKSIRSYYGRQYALGLVADQNPGIPKNAYWLYFFGKAAPFPSGHEKSAIRNKTAVVFVNMVKLKRGYYRFDPELITENASGMQDGHLTLLYRDFLETIISKQPETYLWSHRRWKVPYSPEVARRWIDVKEAPVS